MKPITATAITRRNKIKIPESAPVFPSSNVETKDTGKLATIPAIIIIEIPLPIPLAVICSPSHIKKTVPPVKVTTVVNLKNNPGFITAGPEEEVTPSKPVAIPRA